MCFVSVCLCFFAKGGEIGVELVRIGGLEGVCRCRCCSVMDEWKDEVKGKGCVCIIRSGVTRVFRYSL